MIDCSKPPFFPLLLLLTIRDRGSTGCLVEKWHSFPTMRRWGNMTLIKIYPLLISQGQERKNILAKVHSNNHLNHLRKNTSFRLQDCDVTEVCPNLTAHSNLSTTSATCMTETFTKPRTHAVTKIYTSTYNTVILSQVLTLPYMCNVHIQFLHFFLK